jgi:hypothetical protein
VPLSNFVPRGFGFVHHSIAILYHEVPNLNITIRNFFIAVEWGELTGRRGGAAADVRFFRYRFPATDLNSKATWFGIYVKPISNFAFQF